MTSRYTVADPAGRSGPHPSTYFRSAFSFIPSADGAPKLRAIQLHLVGPTAAYIRRTIRPFHVGREEIRSRHCSWYKRHMDQLKQFIPLVIAVIFFVGAAYPKPIFLKASRPERLIARLCLAALSLLSLWVWYRMVRPH
jgi:hypothetical protein